MRRLLPRLFFLAASVFPLVVGAQEFRATLTGVITDPSGAVVPNASVTAINGQTQQQYSVKSTSSGSYFIPYMLPGTYQVSVSAPGFTIKVQDNVLLEASKSIGLNVALVVGA